MILEQPHVELLRDAARWPMPLAQSGIPSRASITCVFLLTLNAASASSEINLRIWDSENLAFCLQGRSTLLEGFYATFQMRWSSIG